MCEEDAEAALVALAEPLEWEYRRSQQGNHYWDAVWGAEKQITEQKRYSFAVKTPNYLDLRCDENGIPFRCLMVATVKTPMNSPAIPATFRNTDDEASLYTSWEFPCRTIEVAKAVCERFAATKDPAEMNRLAGRRYPLLWGPEGYHSAEALIVGNKHRFVRYVVFSRMFLFSRYFIARYDCHLCKEDCDRYYLRPPAKAPYRYKTESAARAACDRHHITGLWE